MILVIVRTIAWVFGLAVIALPGQAQPRVTVAPLASVALTVHRTAPATVVSLHAATLAAQLSASVIALPYEVGDAVERDAVLALLDCTDYQFAHDQATADLQALIANHDLAGQQLQRLNVLRRSGSAAEETINQKQAELNVAGARIEAQNIAIDMAAHQVDKCVVAAPFTGVITAVHSALGNFVAPQSSLVSLVDSVNVELDSKLSQQQVQQVIASPQLHFLHQGQQYAVVIRTIVNVVDAATQSRTVRLRFPAAVPLAGIKGRLQWRVAGLIVPADLIVTRGTQQGVFMVVRPTPHHYRARFVAIPAARPGLPATLDRPPDTPLITAGHYNLADGDAIVFP